MFSSSVCDSALTFCWFGIFSKETVLPSGCMLLLYLRIDMKRILSTPMATGSDILCALKRALATTLVALIMVPWKTVALAAPTRPVLSKDSHAFQDASLYGIVIRPTDTKGLGAFVAKGISFNAGDWIGEYKGELLTMRDMQARYWNTIKWQTSDRRWKKSRTQRKQGLSGDYVFDVGDGLFLDAEDADISGWCRFMNHAPEILERKDSGEKKKNHKCNVETKWLRHCVDEHGEWTEPRLWFVALRDIECGEELLYDYGDSYWNYH